MAITSPSEYLKAAQQEFKNIPVEAADNILDGYIDTDGGWNVLAIPPTIPLRYHVRMQKVWIAMVLNIVFTNASRKISLAQRHQILQNSL